MPKDVRGQIVAGKREEKTIGIFEQCCTWCLYCVINFVSSYHSSLTIVSSNIVNCNFDPTTMNYKERKKNEKNVHVKKKRKREKEEKKEKSKIE